jgi:hypothetical protein
MKNILRKIAIVATFSIFGFTAFAQNYKAPKIDATGKVTVDGKHVLTITPDGKYNHPSGQNLAYINSEGELVDAKTKKVLGKAEKNGHFIPSDAKTIEEKLTVHSTSDGTYEIKDKTGKVIGIAHESYKQQAAGAIHYYNTK